MAEHTFERLEISIYGAHKTPCLRGEDTTRLVAKVPAIEDAKFIIRAWNSAPDMAAKIERLEAERARLHGLFGELRAAWFKGVDLDRKHISQEVLRIFVAAESGGADR